MPKQTSPLTHHKGLGSNEAPAIVQDGTGHLSAPRSASILGLNAGVALAVSLFGYYSLAGFANVVAPNSSGGGIASRALCFFVVILAYLQTRSRSSSFGDWKLLAPMGIFLTIYVARIIENSYIPALRLEPDDKVILLIFVVSIIAPTILLARMATSIRDEDFAAGVRVLAVLFLIALLLNLDVLSETSTSRLALDKINAIALAQTAMAFLIFFVVFARDDRFAMISAMIVAPILLLVIVYARSRGPWLSGTAAVLVYAILVKGEKKIWAWAGLAAVAIGVAWLGGGFLEIIRTRFAFTSIEHDPSTYLHYIALIGAWDQFLDDFAFGRYIVELRTMFYPHNIYVEVPMAVGIFGLIPFAAHFILACRATVGIIRSPIASKTQIVVAILFIREAIAAAFSGSVWGIYGFWISSALVIIWWHQLQSRHSPLELRPRHGYA